MPYPVLNAIEGLAIREKQEPLEVWWALQARFPDVPAIQLRVWVDRFFRLWCANQWKRERLAPSFHLDDASLDPRTWCRFPILSPGFAEERASLQAAALPEGR
jgi:NAD+ synthase (glutamine-hydrolysing)